jgi:tetratricopeptide (TPR) repeat protein
MQLEIQRARTYQGPNADMRYANLLIDKGEWSQALVELRKICLQESLPKQTYYEAYTQLANLSIQMSDLESAEEFLNISLRLNKDHEAVHILYGIFHLQKNKVLEAVESFQKALFLQPRSEKALYGLCLCYKTIQDGQYFWYHMKKALTAYPNSVKNLQLMAEQALVDFEQAYAIPVLEKYIYSNEIHLTLNLQLVCLLFQDGKIEQAKWELFKLSLFAPENVDVQKLNKLMDGVTNDRMDQVGK